MYLSMRLWRGTQRLPMNITGITARLIQTAVVVVIGSSRRWPNPCRMAKTNAAARARAKGIKMIPNTPARPQFRMRRRTDSVYHALTASKFIAPIRTISADGRRMPEVRALCNSILWWDETKYHLGRGSQYITESSNKTRRSENHLP